MQKKMIKIHRGESRTCKMQVDNAELKKKIH